MTLFRRSDDGVFGHAEFFHHGVAGGGNAETIDGDHFALQADVFPPHITDTLSGVIGGKYLYVRVAFAAHEIETCKIASKLVTKWL
jgi:hypothetical protein